MQIDGKFSTPRKAHDSLGTTRNVNRVRILVRVTARSLPDGRQSESYPETGFWEALNAVLPCWQKSTRCRRIRSFWSHCIRLIPY